MEYKTKISEEEIEELPNFTFDGEIIVIDHEDKIDAAVNDLSSYSHIGFDTETKPAFKKGVTHQVGLLQLATDKRVYLFRLNKCGLSESLQDLLANENIMKIGVGIRDDIRGLRKLANFIPASFLYRWGYSRRRENSRMGSISNLYQGYRQKSPDDIPSTRKDNLRNLVQ